MTAAGTRDRISWLEYPSDDFPYYDGKPVGLTGGQWLLVLAAVAVGFVLLVAPIPAFATRLGQFVPAILFPGVPLATLAVVAGSHWTAIFRRLRGRDLLWMVAFAVLNVLVSIAVGLAIMKLVGAEKNPAVSALGAQSRPEQVLFYLKTLPQLFGEEVLTILPFLALLAFFRARTGLSRRGIIFWAWLLSAALFGAAHLPTYGWNLVQCFALIGSARLVLTLPYIKTKNIWVSTGTHILNDWLTFTVSILGASGAAR